MAAEATRTLERTVDAVGGTAGAKSRRWHRSHRHLVTAVIASGAALIAAALLPRGPVSTSDSVAWMLGALALGFAGGFISGRRWSGAVLVLAFTTAFELGRMGTDGPTVDAVNLGSTYGIIAFVVGRGLTYVLALAPLLLGTLLGVEGAARARHAGARRLGLRGWAGVACCTVIVVVMSAVLLRPATTSPIVGPDGLALAGSVAELTRVPLGGRDQTVMIRGRSTDSPVLLHLAGGPGGTDLGAMRADTSLEDDFVVVTWDQRGTGKSYDALDPARSLTLERMVADTHELSEYLRRRFDEERIYLHGNSWGSLLGVLAVHERPDLYHAWIGSGQMVSPAATDRMFWEDTLAWASETGNQALGAQLLANGPPPYRDVLAYQIALSHEHDWNPYPEWDGDGELPFTLFVPENTLMDQVNGLRAFLDTFSVLYPQIQDVDLRRDAADLEVPVYLVAGTHEARGRALLAADWFERLRAPAKETIAFESSGHRPSFEEPARFAELMRRVRDETLAPA